MAKQATEQNQAGAAQQSTAPISLPPQQEFRTAWIACGAVLLSLTLSKHIAPLTGSFASYIYTAVAALQLYLPLYLTRRMADSSRRLGIHSQGIWDEVKIVALLSLLCFPLFALGHHFYQTLFFGKMLKLQLPPKLGEVVLTHTLAVALPEELFYRGYFQPALERVWRPKRAFFGVYLGKAAVVTAALFAIGHFMGEYNPLRLGPFFPSLLFSWLRNRRGSLWGAIAFHALANIVGHVLFAFYVRP